MKTLKQQIVEIIELSQKFGKEGFYADQILDLIKKEKSELIKEHATKCCQILKEDRQKMIEGVEKMKYDLGCPCKICELHNKDLDAVLALIKNNKLR